jgi:hypothetical protein
VIPAPPPKEPKVAAVPSGGPTGPAIALTVKLHGFGATPAIRATPARFFAWGETVAVYCVPSVRFAVGVNVAIIATGS